VALGRCARRRVHPRPSARRARLTSAGAHDDQQALGAPGATNRCPRTAATALPTALAARHRRPQPPAAPLANRHTCISRRARRRDSHHAASCTIRASEELFRFHIAQVRELGGYLCGRRLYETMLVWETDPSLRDNEPGAAFADV